jgi:hypothetical protein
MAGKQAKESVTVTQYKWAGKLGPFRISKNCDECDLTTSVLQDMTQNEFKARDVRFEVKPWLDNLFYCLARGCWHAPIIMVNGKKFYQYSEKEPLFDREKLAGRVLKEAT